jgi:hypothetical protein
VLKFSYCYLLASSIRKVTIMQRLSVCKILKTIVKYSTEKYMDSYIRIWVRWIWFQSDMDTGDQTSVPWSSSYKLY